MTEMNLYDLNKNGRGDNFTKNIYKDNENPKSGPKKFFKYFSHYQLIINLKLNTIPTII